MSLLGGRVIKIERRGRFSDGQGGFIDSWAEVATERGRVRSSSGRERELGHKFGAEISHVGYIRQGANVKPQDRLVAGSIYLKVHAVRDWGFEGGHLELDCEEQQSGG